MTLSKPIPTIALAIVLVAAPVTGVTFATGTAAADSHGGSTLAGVLDGPAEDQSVLDWASNGVSIGWSAAVGAQDRAGWWLASSNPFADDPPGASEEAASLTTYYNAHNATVERYVNDRENVTSNRTIEVTILLEDTTATRFIVTNATNGNLTNTTMVTSTTRTVDETVTTCQYAAEQSQEELEYFVQEYAEPNEDVDNAYLARLKGRYNDDVETSLYPSDGDCSEEGS